jgi:tetratricopeptide (TPR) repeat protein
MTAAQRAKGLGPDEQAFVDGGPGGRLAAIEATGCPAPALLRAAAVGALPEPLASGVHGHVRSCAICRQLTADLLELDTELDMLEDARIRRRIDRGRRAPLWRVAALAASLTIAAGAGWLALTAADPGPIPPRLALSRPAAPPPSITVLAPDKLEPRVDASALVWRGASDRFQADLAAALKPYAANQFKAAGDALERLAAQYPDRAEPALYLGISRLLMDRPVDAAKALRKAASLGGPDQDDARWYLAVAEYQNGRRAESRQLLAQLCHDNGTRSAEACLAQEQAGDAR